MTDLHKSEGMNFAELWNLILRITNEANDELIESLRVALFVELARREERGPRSNARHLAATLWSFRLAGRPARIPKAKQNLPLLLFPFCTGSHMLNMLPVARQAKARSFLGGIVAGSMMPRDLDEFDGVVTQRTLENLAGASLLPRIMRDVWRSFHRLIELFRRHDSRCALRIKRNYGAIIRQMVTSKRMEIAFRALFLEWKPSCVISTSDSWPFEFQFYCQAKHLGIPNAVIQHGEPNGVISWPAYADCLLVWGDVFRERFQQMGAPSDRMRVCGMPAIDDLFARWHQATPKMVKPKSPMCVVFSHAHDRSEEPEFFDTFARYLTEVISLTPRFQWRIKLHPAEDDSFYRERGFTAHPQVQILRRDVSLQQATEEADVACTIRSTAGLEAMMMHRPVIVIDLLPGSDCSVWWPSQGGGLAAKTPEEFIKYLNRLVDDRDFRSSLLKSQGDFLDKTFANKGKAAAAIVDYLEEQTSAAIDRKENSPREIETSESVGAF